VQSAPWNKATFNEDSGIQKPLNGAASSALLNGFLSLKIIE
jgi:hypothetical protein